MKQGMCICYKVSGKVQGVFFRASTKSQAEQLGITGWVKNLPDGGVEVLACGEKAQLDLLYSWLQSGPERAEVKDITFETLPWQEHQAFTVR